MNTRPKGSIVNKFPSPTGHTAAVGNLVTFKPGSKGYRTKEVPAGTPRTTLGLSNLEDMYVATLYDLYVVIASETCPDAYRGLLASLTSLMVREGGFTITQADSIEWILCYPYPDLSSGALPELGWVYFARHADVLGFQRPKSAPPA